jgi:hypothetical protein
METPQALTAEQVVWLEVYKAAFTLGRPAPSVCANDAVKEFELKFPEWRRK